MPFAFAQVINNLLKNLLKFIKWQFMDFQDVISAYEFFEAFRNQKTLLFKNRLKRISTDLDNLRDI